MLGVTTVPIPYDIDSEGGITVSTSIPFGRMVRAIRLVPGCRIISIHSWLSIITDDCYGRFSIDGYEFDIDTVFSEYYAIIPRSPVYPPEIRKKLQLSFENYKSFLEIICGRLFKRSA